MKSSIKDEAAGVFHEIKGKGKEIAGRLSDNPNLEAEGVAESSPARFREKSGRSRGFWKNEHSNHI